LYARSKVAPGQSSVIRKKLEQQEVKTPNINFYLEQLKSVSRYSSAFQLLYVILADLGIFPETATTRQVAEGILRLGKFSLAQARNAYSGCLLIPGLSSLRFENLLTPLKRKWNCSTQKYSHFWDAFPLLRGLAAAPLTLERLSLSELRLQLIIVCRLLCLHRGVDLAQMLRFCSTVGEKFFILIKRKGWKIHKWEEVPNIPSCPLISPKHLLEAYVAKTAHMGKPGGPVLLALAPPHQPLTANCINSLTKKYLVSQGVPPQWGHTALGGQELPCTKNWGFPRKKSVR
jgi:hypothetical protein